MTAHKRPRMNRPPMACTNMAEPVEKRLVVVLGDKYGISPVAAGYHMVKHTRVMKASLSCHALGWSIPLIPTKFMLIREQ